MQARIPVSAEANQQQSHSAQLAGQLQDEQRRSFEDHSPQAAQLTSLQAMMSDSPSQRRTQALQAKMNRTTPVQQMRTLQTRMTEGDVAQREELEEPLQAQVDGGAGQHEEKANASKAPKLNNTGLPDKLKSGIESMSGMSMDHVKVHYHSDKPAQLNAHAYAQGSDIHIAPGQEQHVPHEAWHVVQQAQGRVKPTMQMKLGVPVNDDVGLESEADTMGARALQGFDNSEPPTAQRAVTGSNSGAGIIQRHILLGAMIKGQDNPAQVDPGAWATISHTKVFDAKAHRGDLTNAEAGAGFDWGGGFGVLDANVKQIRNNNLYADHDPNFFVVANVNTYKTPGFDAIPSTQNSAHLHAFGSGWTLQYNLNPLTGAPNYSADYAQVLHAWRDLPQNPFAVSDDGEELPKLGDVGAAHVLRYMSKKYWQANKNFVIPHRGLRNMALEKIAALDLVNYVKGKKAEDDSDQFVSIVHLDDDLKTSDPMALGDMMKAGAAKTQERVSTKKGSKQKGVAFSAPGYVYNMENNLLEYTASLLSHIAGRVVKGAYPSEPGLTITYDRAQEELVWTEFLRNNPWGIESADLLALPSYGVKQQKARVESKEGRALASQYSQFLIKKQKAPANSAAANKIPIRGSGFVEVAMSEIAKHEIVDRGNPENIQALNAGEMLEWILTYIQRNNYHPAGGTSQDATSFREKVVPKVANFVHGIINAEGDINGKQQQIASALENMSNEFYQNLMKSSGDGASSSHSSDIEIELPNWPLIIASKIETRAVSGPDELLAAANQISEGVNWAAVKDDSVEENMSDTISETVALYAQQAGLSPELSEILDFLVAEIVYGENYSEVFEERKEQENYRQILESIGR